MSIVNILDTVTDWARQNICSQIQLKVPPKSTEPSDDAYEYQTANPVAFTMYVPTEDKLPKGIPSAFPSLCVRFMEGESNLRSMNGTIGIQLLLSVWSPGTYNADLPAGSSSPFERNGEGWRDAWNFTDIAVQAVERVTNISGYEIDRSVPVKYGPLTEQEAIPDFYPFWFTWVTFQLTYPLLRNIQDTQEFL